MIRIGIDGSLACESKPTGVGHFARSLLQELLVLPAPGIARFVYLPPYADFEAPARSEVTLRRRPDVNTLIKTPWLISQTWRDRLDVFYSFGHLVQRGCRGRRVITVYDTAYDEFPECYPPGTSERAHREVLDACGSAAAVAVPSTSTGVALCRDYLVPSQKVHVILAGSRPALQPGPPGRMPERLVLAGIATPFFLCVGRIDPRKNLPRVIDAYRQVVRARSGAAGLVIVGPDDLGSGTLREKLEQGRAPGERIVVTGYLDDSELIDLYRRCIALVYPSLAEGFGLPVLEGMACGAPVITSNVSSMPEVAGGAACLVDPTDTGAMAAAMGRILHDPGLREQMSAAGLLRARELTWRATAERLLSALTEAAHGG